MAVVAAAPTGLLAGDPASPAAAALVDMAPEPADDADIVDGLMLTRLDVALAADATVGQVNAALGDIGGSIVAMRAVQLSIDAELGGGQDKELLFSLQGPGIVIEDRDGGTVRQTVRIGPGRYFIAITATAVAIGTTSPSGSASFSLSLVFAP